MEARLIANSVLDPVTDCWIWIAARDKRASTPYGKITTWCKERRRRFKRQAHIVSYETFIGPVPAGHEIDHKCRNGFCIAPDHLQAGTPTVNKGRRVYKHTAKTTAYTGAVA
jgi:HNH endonuclease